VEKLRTSCEESDCGEMALLGETCDEEGTGEGETFAGETVWEGTFFWVEGSAWFQTSFWETSFSLAETSFSLAGTFF